MSRNNNQNPFKLNELAYYFQSQHQDYLDRGAIDYRNSQILELRERLLSLPPSEFEVAIRTLRKMVNTSSTDAQRSEKEHQQKRKEALNLFSQVSKGAEAGNASQKITPI
jgi:hypothetical protein